MFSVLCGSFRFSSLDRPMVADGWARCLRSGLIDRAVLTSTVSVCYIFPRLAPFVAACIRELQLEVLANLLGSPDPTSP
jgi:hypothetical protein